MSFPSVGRLTLFLRSIKHKHSVSNYVIFSLVRRRTLVQNAPFDPSSSSTYTLLSPSQQLQLESEKHDRQLESEVRDRQVGITEFLGSHPKVIATIKQECADFQVHEIDPSGQRVQLTDDTSSIQEDRDGPKRKDKKHIICTLYKENMEHSRAVGFIAKSLEIHPHSISFAGRKDKRGQSSQRISISSEELSIPQLAHVSSFWTPKNIKLGNFTYSSNPLVNGQLQANHFNILLRDIKPAIISTNHHLSRSTRTRKLPDTTSMVDRAIASLMQVGFVNYFGLQRFGFDAHNIGLAVLRLDWEKVFDLILAPRPDDFDVISNAKALWFSERNPKKIIKQIPHTLRHGVNETGVLLAGLALFYDGGKGDLEKAYLKIPKIMRSFHITAVTSLLWNQLVSFRLQKFGMSILPGDFVQVSSSHQKRNRSASSKKIYDEPLQMGKTFKMLTEEDLASNNNGHSYSIYDVFLPVLGSKLNSYPNPILQHHYEKLLADHGLKADCLSETHLRNEVAKGFYRPMIVKPSDVTYQIFPYNDKDNLSQFMPSDLDLLENGMNHQGGEVKGQKMLVNKVGGKKKDKLGAVLSFTLGTSSYATMALREVMQTANFVQT